jgi:hypothetical protein
VIRLYDGNASRRPVLASDAILGKRTGCQTGPR